MRRTLFCTVTALSLATGGLMLGCEETVSRQSETKTKSDGTTITKEEKVTRAPDGTTTKTQSVDVDKPDRDNDGDKEVKIKVDTDK